MRHLISMTSILTNWLGTRTKREITLNDLEEGTFYFGCMKEHLSGIPFEATWSNKVLPRIYDRKDVLEYATVSVDKVDENLRDRVNCFLSCVRAADKAGRVHWEVGNYPALRDKLAAEAEES